mmetsp:Transcript_15932/g.55478  ORF Transcript_15932/g.55478 Transcript_15932/m.55478 type:complete len:767 (-) Transcript_15932:1193-3493(-)
MQVLRRRRPVRRRRRAEAVAGRPALAGVVDGHDEEGIEGLRREARHGRREVKPLEHHRRGLGARRRRLAGRQVHLHHAVEVDHARDLRRVPAHLQLAASELLDALDRLKENALHVGCPRHAGHRAAVGVLRVLHREAELLRDHHAPRLIGVPPVEAEIEDGAAAGLELGRPHLAVVADAVRAHQHRRARRPVARRLRGALRVEVERVHGALLQRRELRHVVPALDEVLRPADGAVRRRAAQRRALHNRPAAQPGEHVARVGAGAGDDERGARGEERAQVLLVLVRQRREGDAVGDLRHHQHVLLERPRAVLHGQRRVERVGRTGHAHGAVALRSEVCLDVLGRGGADAGGSVQVGDGQLRVGIAQDVRRLRRLLVAHDGLPLSVDGHCEAQGVAGVKLVRRRRRRHLVLDHRPLVDPLEVAAGAVLAVLRPVVPVVLALLRLRAQRDELRTGQAREAHQLHREVELARVAQRRDVALQPLERGLLVEAFAPRLDRRFLVRVRHYLPAAVAVRAERVAFRARRRGRAHDAHVALLRREADVAERVVAGVVLPPPERVHERAEPRRVRVVVPRREEVLEARERTAVEPRPVARVVAQVAKGGGLALAHEGRHEGAVVVRQRARGQRAKRAARRHQVRDGRLLPLVGRLDEAHAGRAARVERESERAFERHLARDGGRVLLPAAHGRPLAVLAHLRARRRRLRYLQATPVAVRVDVGIAAIGITARVAAGVTLVRRGRLIGTVRRPLKRVRVVRVRVELVGRVDVVEEL